VHLQQLELIAETVLQVQQQLSLHQERALSSFWQLAPVF